MTTPLPKLLQPALKALEKDLLARAKLKSVEAGLRQTWCAEQSHGETGQGFDPWRRERVTQLAVAWVLSVVFVRTLEDRGLIDPRVAGTTAEALHAAEDRESTFTQLAPFLGAREYLLTVFRELSRLPGAKDVFDRRHNPVWTLSPSAEGARALLEFFRKQEDGKVALTFAGPDSRFLGDLYQDLSAEVRERYALLQTPDFVEAFILEQTLDPAITEFGLAEVRLIDPTCGSGHFLLGGFRRLYERWRLEQPAEAAEVLARRALAQVSGVDLNPYAVAIARFRLVLAFVEMVGIKRLEKAPELSPDVVVADSLLHRFQTVLSDQLSLEDEAIFGSGLFRLEARASVEKVLKRRYHAVVGNPPYITEKDAKKRETYRKMYDSASGKYSLSAPFTERFFELGVAGGFVGLINSNAWTKRDFGTALIEKVLPKLDLQKIIDTSGCYIPGHGTPTLLMFGRNRAPGGTPVVAVLGKRGEQSVPEDPANAPVWYELVAHHDEVGFEGQFVSVETMTRTEVAKTPWVLVGGGSRSLLRSIEGCAQSKLEASASEIGFASFPGNDDAFVLPHSGPASRIAPPKFIKPFVTGEAVRDWSIEPSVSAATPYDDNYELIELTKLEHGFRHFWPLRTSVLATTGFGGESRAAAGDSYWAWYRWIPARYRAPYRISFGEVATHNHFVLDRGGKVFKQTAPIIKLKPEYTEADHQALLGYLNSSTMAFWGRLVFFQKGGDQVGDGARLSKTPWQDRLQMSGNLLGQLPVPDLARLRESLLPLVVEAEATVSRLAEAASAKVLAAALAESPTLENLETRRDVMFAERTRLRGILVSLQEEMDWRVYGLFELPTVTAATVDEVLVPVAPEHRPAEVHLAREVATDISASEWFRIHQRTPPTDVGGPLAGLYRQRLTLLDHPEHGKNLRLLETPETKRRWPATDDAKAFLEAARTWLLDWIEDIFREQPQPELLTPGQLSQELSKDPRVQAITELLTRDSGSDLVRIVSTLVEAEGVPYLAALRYTETGLEKRKLWEEVWELQRAEDQGTLDAALRSRNLESIPVPDKYVPKDFQRNTWSHRGALDVPKERFTIVPSGASDIDPTPLVGWAGWDALRSAQALSGLYQRRKVDDGWTQEQLVPLLAGLEERVPWLLQWHDAPSEEFGGTRLGGFFRDFVQGEAQALGYSTAELRAWKPQPANCATAERTRRPRAPAVTAEMVLQALRSWTGEGNPRTDDLVELVGGSKPRITEHLKALVESGHAEQTHGRPARFRATSAS